MPEESDIRVLTQRVQYLQREFIAVRDDFKSSHEKLNVTMDKLAVNINRLVECDIKRDERDKSREQRESDYGARLAALEADTLKLKLYVAADEPIRQGRDWMIRSVIGIIVAGVFYAAFTINK
ncbi:hypothetical protein S349_49 [Shewanella sp. phage 3/49]|uniref:hypothetical protein n=1 Tax=Shewanella sp. phage 3/49 TaxID=1458863 RepID=UPI0004F654F7|nr:hypothetical protein S349_49 [Shewanella sp. phage 3/49]AHK11839.1 hypothetical protein S349_49 [Shewanella sp. phage 3/49]